MWWRFFGDFAAVTLFIGIGQGLHERPDGMAAMADTAVPFLIGVSLAWTFPSIRRCSASLVCGAVSALVTAGVGVALRSLVFGDSIALGFILVTVAFLISSFVGWRYLWARCFGAAAPKQIGRRSKR